MKPNQRYYLLSSLTSIMNHWTRAELVSLLSFPDGSKAMIKQVHLNISYIDKIFMIFAMYRTFSTDKIRNSIVGLMCCLYVASKTYKVHKETLHCLLHVVAIGVIFMDLHHN